MTLRPCPSCQRHIQARDAACPFCATANATRLQSSALATVGRMSRAAIFAGLAACSSSTPPVHQATPPPTPPNPALVQQFDAAPAPAAGKASIRGFVHRDGQPLVNVRVKASGEQGEQGEHETTTGPHGEYMFVNIVPGEWTVTLDADAYDAHRYSRRPQDTPMGQPHQTIAVSPDENRRFDLTIYSPPLPEPDRGPCCKPYGAPPARRRIV